MRWRQSFLARSRGAFVAGGVDAEPGSTIPPKHVASRTGVDDPGYNSSPIT